MGYLNNATRVLDAILTRKGREILSRGGDFTVTKFALGDDEIDYGLWDTTHAQGTDYYGAVIEGLPALEPFNDPSEIMKYKLVTRSEGTRAMASLFESAGSQTALNGLKWYSDDNEASRIQIGPVPSGDLFTNIQLGQGVDAGVQHTPNVGFGAIDLQGGIGSIFEEGYLNEEYTLTLLDTTVAVIAPVNVSTGLPALPKNRIPLGTMDEMWLPFVKTVQHISQTITGCLVDQSGTFRSSAGTEFGNQEGKIRVYPKRIAENSSPAKTSLLITGETSGATKEFTVNITYTAGSPS